MTSLDVSTRASVRLFLATFALVFYGMGAAFVESFVNYPTWPLVGTAAFPAFHQALSARIIPVMGLPMLLTTVLTAFLLWLRPAPIPRWALWTALALQVITWISTAAIQLPIQLSLSADGLSLPLIDRLIFTNLWLRRVPHLLSTALFLWMMSLMLRGSYARGPGD